MTNEKSNAERNNDVVQNIMTRKSVREYADKAIDDADIEVMMRAAMAAPSACNKQPWRFLVIRDREMLREIGETFHNAHMAADAPLAVVVCGDRTAFFEGEGEPYWCQDCAAAIENMMLAAKSLGIGTVWCGFYPIHERVVKISEMLSLPEEIIPMSVVVAGYPVQEGAPKDKWHPEYVHYEKW